MNNFGASIKPPEETLMEYYTSAISRYIAMFVKRSVNPSLLENYEEAIKVLAELESINKHSVEPDIRTFGCSKPLLLTRPKEEHSNELEGVVKMV